MIGLFSANGSIHHLDTSTKSMLLVKLCNMIGLNQYTRPFRVYRNLQGEEFIYATKDCCAQLRHLFSISITSLQDKIVDNIVIVTASGINKFNRMSMEIGSVNLNEYANDNQDRANCIMWATTKAKRRLTLDLAGLGVLADVELRDMKEVVEYNVLEEAPKQLEKGTSTRVSNTLDLIKVPFREEAKK